MLRVAVVHLGHSIREGLINGSPRCRLVVVGVAEEGRLDEFSFYRANLRNQLFRFQDRLAGEGCLFL